MPPTQMVDLMVRDTGSGMPAGRLHRIFDPYYSTKAGPDASGKGGTGLGLSTAATSSKPTTAASASKAPSATAPPSL